MAKQENNQNVPSPLRGLNLDVPIHLMQSGDMLDGLNFNYANHSGALGRRGCFNSASVSTGMGKLQAFVEWTDASGNYYLVYKTYGSANIYAWNLAGTSVTTLGTCSTTEPGSLFVFGCDLYYVDSSHKWFYGHNAAGTATLYNGVWGIGAASVTVTATFIDDGALDPGHYRWCVVPYDSKRDIEGRRSAFTEPLRIGMVAQNEGDEPVDQPEWVSDPTNRTGFRPILQDGVYPPEGDPDYFTGGARITWGGSNAGGRWDKWRIYRTANDTDFINRGKGNHGSSFSQLAVLIGQVSSSTYSFSDYGGVLDGNWQHDKLDQAGEDVDYCRMAVQYGSEILFFATSTKPGGYERSVPGRYCNVARIFDITEGNATRTRSPKVQRTGGVCPIPVSMSAVMDYGGQKLLFTRLGMYRISGYDRSPVIEPVDLTHGCAGMWQIARTDYGLVWYDGSGLVRYAGGIEPFPTQGVQAVLQSIPLAERDNVAVGYCSLTRELLVSYKATTQGGTQYILAYDFARQLWSKYSVSFTIYGFLELNRPGYGKSMYAFTSSGLQLYPYSTGETFSSSYAQAVFGVEDQSTMKKIVKIRAMCGATLLKFTMVGCYSAGSTAGDKTVTITMGSGELSNSYLLQAASFQKLGGRYFKVKIEPATASDDWSFGGFDILKVQADPI